MRRMVFVLSQLGLLICASFVCAHQPSKSAVISKIRSIVNEDGDVDERRIYERGVRLENAGISVSIGRNADQILVALSKLEPPFASKIHAIRIEDKKVSSRGLECLAQLSELEELESAKWDNKWASTSLQQTNLRSLYLHGVGVTGAGLEEICKIKSLEVLMLGRNDIDGHSLKALKDLHSLRQLSLSGKRITDRDIAVFSDLPNLRILFLNETSLSDAAADALGKCTKLELLTLNNSEMTQDGESQIQKLLPNCTVIISK